MTSLTLQATGSVPFTIDAEGIAHVRDHLPGDKRGIIVAIYRQTGGRLYASCMYLTEWPTEYDQTWLFSEESLLELASAMSAHAVSPGFLPPGAGYPATPNFEARQEKLIGTFQSFSLHAITKALEQASNSLNGG